MSGFAVNIVPWHSHGNILQAIRDTVFITEQRVPESLERDPDDAAYIHALAITDAGEPIGTGRLLPDSTVSRMAVLPPWRSKGVGTRVLASLVHVARNRGDRMIFLHAQTSAKTFYQKQGFTCIGETFLEAGIPHIRMHLTLDGDSA